MMLPTDDELRAKEDAFKKLRRPDSLGYLAQLRKTLIRFHLDGYSRKSMFDFLEEQNLVRCSKATFYRWIADNMDFDRESREYLAEDRLAREGARTPRAPLDESGGGATPARDAVGETAASGEGGQSRPETATTTEKTTVESRQASAPTAVASSKEASLQLLDSALQGIEQQDMGAVAARARARSAPPGERDRGGGDG